jgi:adenosylcobinamide-GDP ribazoletransferase
MAYREFGGITGDLAGWFLQVCELVIAASAALTYRIMEVM